MFFLCVFSVYCNPSFQNLKTAYRYPTVFIILQKR
nr:MAG TPA: hypothetical protein [Caudoviricetes sp.]